MPREKQRRQEKKQRLVIFDRSPKGGAEKSRHLKTKGIISVFQEISKRKAGLNHSLQSFRT